MLFKDSVQPSNRFFTDEGYLVVNAVLARTGIQEYYAKELGIDDKNPYDVIRVYRPPNEVFNSDSMKSFEGKPVTNNHPPELVNLENITKYQKGHVVSNVIKDGQTIKAQLVITDKETINLIENGKTEISNGYTAEYIQVQGMTADGVECDYMQTNIRGNHIAVVNKGRCGKVCAIEDEKKVTTDCTKGEKKGMKYFWDKAFGFRKSFSVDSEEAEEVLKEAQDTMNELKDENEELKKENNDLKAQLDRYKTKDSDEEEKEKESKDEDEKEKTDDEEEEEKKESKDSKKGSMDAATITKLVNERISILDKVKSLSVSVTDSEMQSLSNYELAKKAVTKAYPGISIKDKSKEYVQALFDAISVSQVGKTMDGLTKAIFSSQVNDTATNDVNEQLTPREQRMRQFKGDNK